MTDRDRVEQWLERFAAGAGAHYRWECWGGGMLRTWVDHVRLCPLTAQYAMDSGQLVRSADVYLVVMPLGLAHPVSSYLINSADRTVRSPWYDAEIRAQLLCICGLEER